MTDEMAPMPNDDAGLDAWTRWCADQLEIYEQTAQRDPMTNSVRRLAHQLFEAERAGDLNIEKIADIAKGLSDEALLARADEFKQRRCVKVSARPDDAFIDDMLATLDGAPFATVQQDLERARAGIVFTAHPTFAMSRRLRAIIADYADADVVSDAKRQEITAAIRAERHAPDDKITLLDEHDAAQEAIVNAKAAVRDVNSEILDWARGNYPLDWKKLSPTPISVASWVGYDLDGRTDIHWGQTFAIRLQEKADQLNAYGVALQALAMGVIASEGAALSEKLIAASALAAEQAELFRKDLDDAQCVTEAANHLTRDDPRKMTSLEGAIEIIDRLIEKADGDAQVKDLCLLRSDMRNYGLGASRIHLRINAAQVRSALSADLGIEANRRFIDRTALKDAAQKAKDVSRRRINIASIFLEEMTARRQLMLCAEFIKHIDADTPIRFLIAECEAPATVMGTVYLARLYGIEHRVDISPLFETPDALEQGGRFMARLLDEEAFVEYIRARGRVAVQIGFSDSGRFMGQMAANLATERLQILLARALSERDITDVEVLIFNTHGESMGRGGYPGDLNERFDHLITPWTRARYAKDGLQTNLESSWQGGDGYLHFATPNLAATSVRALCQWSFDAPAADGDDPFYGDINYSWDLFRVLTNWQEKLFDDDDYQIVIGAFGPSMLFSTGSRKLRRQSGAVVTGPRALRAIPHNAILQQMAAPANVAGGFGTAGGVEPDRLRDYANRSARLQQVLKMITHARRLTSMPALRAYAYPFSASLWISKSALDNAGDDAPAFAEIAANLRDSQTATSIHRLADLFAADLTPLDRILSDLTGANFNTDRRDHRRPLHALHAARQALIMKGIYLAAIAPRFSQRHDLTRQTLFEMAFGLRFDELAAVLEDVFPAHEADAALLAGVEEESDEEDMQMHGYPAVHAEIIEPLRQIHRSIREIGVGIAHFYGAFG
ncbi:MAG: phosphoenolpyruvate carboxylase [Pseudomonadota bacterium]